MSFHLFISILCSKILCVTWAYGEFVNKFTAGFYLESKEVGSQLTQKNLTQNFPFSLLLDPGYFCFNVLQTQKISKT